MLWFGMFLVMCVSAASPLIRLLIFRKSEELTKQIAFSKGTFDGAHMYVWTHFSEKN